MYLQNQILKERAKVWGIVGRIQEAISADDEDLSELLEISRRRFKTARSCNRDIPLPAAGNLCQKLNIDVEDFIDESFDYNALVEQYKGNTLFVPPKYLEGAYITISDYKRIFNYIDSYYKKPISKLILRYLQTTEESLSSNRLINIKFATECMGFMEKSGLPFIDLFKMGVDLTFELLKKEDFEPFEQEKNLADFFYKTLNSYPSKFSWDHSFENLTNSGFTLNSKPKEKISKEELHIDSGFCLYRKGVLTALPLGIQGKTCQMRKISCIYSGDSSCSYAVER